MNNWIIFVNGELKCSPKAVHESPLVCRVFLSKVNQAEKWKWQKFKISSKYFYVNFQFMKWKHLYSALQWFWSLSLWTPLPSWWWSSTWHYETELKSLTTDDHDDDLQDRKPICHRLLRETRTQCLTKDSMPQKTRQTNKQTNFFWTDVLFYGGRWSQTSTKAFFLFSPPSHP